MMTFRNGHIIELSDTDKHLEWDYVKDINALIAGRRGSGKSFLAMYIAYKMLGIYPYTQLFIIDYKRSDFSRLKNLKNFPNERVASTKEEIFNLLEYYTELMDKRTDYFNTLENTFGKTAHELGMPPFYLIYDEFGAFTATLDSKEKKKHEALIKKITLMGRQYSFGIVIISQAPSVLDTGISSSVKQQLGLTVSMGNTNPAALRQIFREDVDASDMKFEVGQGQLWMDSFQNSNKTYPFTAFYIHKDMLWKQFEINVYDQDVDKALFAHN